MVTREQLVAPCGLDCGICELYMCKDNSQLKEFLIQKGVPEASLPCPGCRTIEGRCPVIQKKCATYTCAENKGINLCSECNEFPCMKIAPAADKASALPHNLKVYNLSVIKERGLQALIDCSNTTKQTYFKGNMKVGEGPIMEG